MSAIAALPMHNNVYGVLTNEWTSAKKLAGTLGAPPSTIRSALARLQDDGIVTRKWDPDFDDKNEPKNTGRYLYRRFDFTPEERLKLAKHEAGHAVLLLAFDAPFDYAWIVKKPVEARRYERRNRPTFFQREFQRWLFGTRRWENQTGAVMPIEGCEELMEFLTDDLARSNAWANALVAMGGFAGEQIDQSSIELPKEAFCSADYDDAERAISWATFGEEGDDNASYLAHYGFKDDDDAINDALRTGWPASPFYSASGCASSWENATSHRSRTVFGRAVKACVNLEAQSHSSW